MNKLTGLRKLPCVLYLAVGSVLFLEFVLSVKVSMHCEGHTE